MTITGDATEVFGSGSSAKTLSLALGNTAVAATASTVAIPATTGLVLSNGALTSLNAKATATNWSIAGAGVSFTALVGYTSSTDLLTVTGSATFSQSEVGVLNVLLGTTANGTNPGTTGLVLSGGQVSAFDMTVNSNITTGGLTFSTIGLRMVYTAVTGKFSLTGTSSLNFNSNTISVTFGGSDSHFGSSPTDGLVITNGVLTSLDMLVNSSITVGSLAFQADHLKFTENLLNSSHVFTMTGTTHFTATGIGSVTATFGTLASDPYPATTGLVVTNGQLTSLDMSITSNLSVSNVTFTTNGLRFTYASANDQFTLAGSASATVGGIGNLTVTFGYTTTTNGVSTTTPGLVVKNGSLVNLDMTINTQIGVGEVSFNTVGLEFTYAQSSQTYTLTGSAGISIGGTTGLTATFGHTKSDGTRTPGLVIKQGNLESLDLTVNASFSVSSISFGVQDLEITYQNTSQFPAGTSYTAGTYYSGNYVSSSVTSYDSTKYIFGISGTAYITVGGVDRLSVSLGHLKSDGTRTAGLVIKRGKLMCLDFTISADFKVGSVQFGVRDLEFVYQNTSQFDGNTAYTAGTFYTGNYKNDGYDAGQYIFGMSGTAYITVGGMDRLSVTLGHTNTDGTKTAGLVIKNGNLEFLDVTVNASFQVSAVTFGVRDLEFVYQNTSQFPANTKYVAGTFYTGSYVDGGYDASKYVFGMAGTAFITFGGLDGLSVTLGHRKSDGTQTPGLVIVNGKLESIDVTINAQFTVSGITFGVQDLEFTYQNTSQLPNGTKYIPGTFFDGTYDTSKSYSLSSSSTIFTMAGTAFITVGGMDKLSVTFGHHNSDGSTTQGLVIVAGHLESIDVTINANFLVSGVTFGVRDLEFIYQNRSQIPDTALSTYTPGTVYRGDYDTNKSYTENYSFSMSGTAFINVGSLSLSITFGHQNRDGSVTPGLLISNGHLVSLDVYLNTSFNVGTMAFNVHNLNFTYVTATDTFTMQGTASVTMFGGMSSVDVTLGKMANDGTVIENGIVVVGGQFRSLDMTVNSDFDIELVKFKIKDLRIHYSELAATVDGVSYPAKTFIMSGMASVTIPILASVDVVFGGNGTQGLVITNGVVQSVNMTVNAEVLKFDGYALGSAVFVFNYSASIHTFTMTGHAKITLPELGVTLITMGDSATAGLVVNTQTNVVTTFNMTVNSDFALAGMKFGHANLVMAYSNSNHQFTMTGVVKMNLGISDYTANLGGRLSDGTTSQGLVIVDGKLKSLDLTITDTMGMAGLSIGTVSLYVGYDGPTHTFDFKGTADATLSAKLPSWVTKYFGIPSGSFHVGTVDLTIHVAPGGTQASGLENAPVTAVSGGVDPSVDLPWTYGINTGIITPVSPNALPPIGDKVKYITSNGSLTDFYSGFEDGKSYNISFAAAQNSGNSSGQTIAVTIDGKSLGVFTPTNSAYQSFTTSTFTPGTGNHTIAFSGLGSGVTAYVSNVSVNGAAAQPTLTTPLTNPTPFNQALSFNGTSNSLSIPSMGLSDFTSGFTAGMWVYPTQSSDWQRLFNLSDQGGGNQITLYQQGGQVGGLSFVVNKNGSSTYINVPNAMKLNTWQYLSVTLNTAGQATLYNNGIALSTGAVSVPAVATRSTSWIGGNDSSSYLYHGQMNSFSLWNTALTLSQVQVAQGTIYTGTESGLVGYWPMNATGNGSVFDRGPNKSNGTTTATTVSIATAAIVSGQNSYVSSTGAMTFDGSSTYVKLPSAGFENFTNGFSAGVWVYPTAAANLAPFFDFGNGSGSNNITLYRDFTSTDLDFGVWGGSNGTTYDGLKVPNALLLNTWQYLSVTMTSAQVVTIYRDGIALPNGTKTLAHMPTNVTRTNNYIGKSNWSGNSLFTGQMGALSVWNTALTSTQVTAGMTTVYSGNESNLIGFWPLSGTASTPTSTVVADTSFTNAQVFTSSSAATTIPSTGLDNFTSGFSAGVWIYPTQITSQTIVSLGNGTWPAQNIQLTIGASGQLGYYVGNNSSSGGGITSGNNVVTLNQWQYLSVSMDSAGNATLYRNGTQVGTGSIAVPVNLTRSTNNLGVSFIGQMSSVSIWNAPLSQSQVQAAANTRFDGSETNLVSYNAMGFNPPAVTPNLSPAVPLPYSTSTAQVFNGTSDSIRVPGTNLTDFTQGFSAGVWVYPTSTASNAAFFDLGNSDQKNDILLWRNGTTNDLKLWIFKDGVSTTLTASSAISLNAWQYFSVTVTSAGVATIYKNGVSIATSTNVGFVPNAVDRTSNAIGANNWQTSLFAGQMMGLSVWKTALSSSQVSTYSNASTPRLSGNEESLVGFWPMDGSPAAGVTDIGPNGLNGTLMGATSYATTGTGYNTPYAGSLTFNGTQTYVSIPNTNLSNFTNGFSAGVWVYPTAVKSWSRIFDFGNGGNNNDILLCRNGTTNDLLFQVGQGNLYATGAITLNTWQYFSVTATSGGVATIYKNGVPIATTTNSNFVPANVTRLYNYVGKSPYNDPLFAGQMNSLSVWNTSLTQTQIQAGMNTAYAGTESGLIGYWPMNETSGSTVNDHTANASNGTVMGGVFSQTTNTGIIQDNLDFQSTSLAAGSFSYSPANTGWTYSNNAGIATNGSGFNPSTAPVNSQVAFIQSTTSTNGSMSTTLTGFAPNQVYSLSFDAAQRAGSPNQGVQISLDGTSLGTFTPSSAANSSGTPMKSALNFDGRTSYVNLPSTGLDNFTNGFSAGVWVYPTSTASYQRFFDFGNGANVDNIFLSRYGTTNQLTFAVTKSGTQTQYNTTNAVIDLNTWQYFSVTVTSGGVLTLYKNGVSVGTETKAGYVPGNVTRKYNYVGKSNWSTDPLYSGQMGDLSVWNTALTSTQVSTGFSTGYVGTESNLVGLWHLGDVNTTSKGLGASSDITLNGNFTPGAASTSTLPFQRPLNFDGTTNYVSLGSNGLDDFTNGFSAGVWVYPTAATSNARIFDFGNGSSSNNILLWRSGTSNGLLFSVFQNSTENRYTVPNAIDLNTWQYFSVTVSSAGLTQVYKNGTLILNADNAYSNTNVNYVPKDVIRTNNYIGKSNWSDPLFAGQIGELSVWNKTLTPAEVRTGYSTGYKGTESNLVGLWHLGDLGPVIPDSGPSTRDAGVNGNVNAVRFTSGYQRFTIPAVMPGAGPHTLTFTGTNPINAADCTAFLSNIAFTTSPFLPAAPAITYAPPAFINGSFENTSYTARSSGGTGYSYNPTGLGWTFSNSAGFTQHAYGLDNGTDGNYTASGSGDAPPDGSYEAFLQTTGSTSAASQASMTQTVSGFVAGQFYDLSLFVKSRNMGTTANYGFGFRSNFTVSMDGVSLGTYAAASATKWVQITIPGISPGPGSHTFTFTTTSVLPLMKNGVTYTKNTDGTTPDCTILLDQIQFLNSGADTVAASQNPSLPSTTSGPHNSYAAFTVNISGVKVGMQVYFDGRVNVIYGDVLGQAFEQLGQDLTQAYKATAQALSSAYTSVAGGLTSGAKLIAEDFEAAENEISAAAANAAKQLIKSLKKLGKKLKHFFNYSVSDATVYYDSTGLYVQDPAQTTTTDAGGGFTLNLPAIPTGQLVGYGGTDTATGLHNDALFTAVASSDVLSPLTTLVNNLVVKYGYTESAAISIVDAAVGSLGTTIGAGELIIVDGESVVSAGEYVPYNFDAIGTMERALAGDVAAGRAFAAEVKTYLAVHEIAALLKGLPGNQSNLTISALMSHAFVALSDSFCCTGGYVDLSDATVIESLMQATANSVGLTIDASLSAPAAGIIARAEAALTGMETQSSTTATAPGNQQFLELVAAIQTLADGKIAGELTRAAGMAVDATNGINSLAVTYTVDEINAEAATTIIGNLLPPTVTVRSVNDSVGVGQNNYLDFEVDITGNSSPLLPISVDYATMDDTAFTANGDYTSVSGTLTWQPGDTAPKFIRVLVSPGTLIQAAKQFELELSAPHNALLQVSVGVGTIDNRVIATTTTIEADTNQSNSYSPVTFSVLVTNQEAIGSVADGIVSFYDGSTLLGMSSLDSTGKASLTSSSLSVGSHSISVVFNGHAIPGAKYLTSTSGSLTVNIASSSQSINFGSISNTTYGAEPIVLNASSTFGLPINYAVTSGPASIVDGVLTITGAGTVTVEATQAGNDQIQAATPVDVTFQVAPAILTVTIDNQTKVYGAEMPTLSYLLSGLVGSDTANSLAQLPTLSTVDLLSHVGVYSITGTGLTDGNYTAEYIAGQLAITPAALIVTIHHQSMVYGGTLPTLTCSITGLIGSDTASSLSQPPVITTGDPTSGVGDFPISVAISDPNYQITEVPATLTITPAPLTISANSYSMTRDQALPDFGLTYDGLVNGDTIDQLPQQAIVTRSSTSMDAGTYDLTPFDAIAPNYLISYSPGTLTINKTTLTFTVNTTDWYIGLGATQLSGTFSGFINGEDVSSLTSHMKFAAGGEHGDMITKLISATPSEALQIIKEALSKIGEGGLPSNMTLGSHGASSVNYDIVVNPGQLHVVPAESTTNLTASSLSPNLGESITFTAMTNLFVNVEGAESHPSHPVGFVKAIQGTVDFQVDGVDVGASGACDDEGIVSFSTSTLSKGLHTVTAIYRSGLARLINGNSASIEINVQGTPSEVTISSSNSTSVYGQPAQVTASVTNTAYATTTATGTMQFLVDGVSYGDAVALANGQATISLPATLIVGNHQISAAYSGDTTFYSSQATPLTQTVTKAIATINVSSYAVAYDGAAHTATGVARGYDGSTLSGLVLSGTTHTNAGQYSQDTWSFHDVTGNYADASGTISNRIGSAPVISTQPVNVSVLAGATASFTVVATADPAPTIQWQVSTNSGSSWSNIPNATSATYSLSTVVSNGGYQYRAVVTNPVGMITSSVATLTVNSRSFSTLTTYTTTVFTGLTTGSINLVDIVDPQAISQSATYTATINWGDGNIDTNVAVSHPSSDGTTIHVLGNHVYAVGGTDQ